MQKNQVAVRAQRSAKSAIFWLQSAVLVAATMLPVMTVGQAGAAQLTARKVTISNSKISSTNVQHDFQFTTATSAAVRGIVFEFCTAPLGTCTLPTGMSVQSSTWVSQSGFPGSNVTAGTGAFAPRSSPYNTGACNMTSNTFQACYYRTDATAAAGTFNLAVTAITAPSAKQSVYVRVGLYSDVAYATLTDAGTVAEAFVDQLTVNGRVQERLDFCVASIDAVASLPASVTACAALASTAIDIGIVDNSSLAVSPVTITSTNGSNNKYGILMSNTNASGGLSISYYPESAATGTNQLRSFRVPGATCNALTSTLTDQCFRETLGGTSNTTIVAGNEYFGMYIACIDNTQGSLTTSLSVPAGAIGYDGTDGSVTSAALCQSEAGATDFAWDSAGTATVIASGTSVVDDEIVKIRFGSSASATTPTGSYSVVTTYIATPTF